MRDWLPGFGFSLVVHLVVLALLGFSLMRQPTPLATPVAEVEAIEAVAVDEAKVQAELERLRNEERKSRDAEQKRQRELAERARKAEQARRQEEQRLSDLKKQAAEESRKAAEAEKQRKAQEKAEQQRIAKLKAEQEALARKKVEEERRLAQLEQQRKLEAEKEAARQKAEAERKRKEEEERKRKAAEAELQKKMAAEQAAEEARQAAERKRQLQQVQVTWAGLIKEKVERNWIRPADSPQNFTCKVLVRLLPDGEVVSAQITESCGNSVLDRSVENAVRRASPLPKPSDPAAFEREIVFTFIPRG